jgi:DNA-binding winged helix-turn-helix (wHTH) protein
VGREVLYRCENCVLDTARRELYPDAALIMVEPQVFDLLVFLVGNRDRVVSKDDLLATVWGGRIVSESTLGSRINAARRVIGDTGKDQRLIRTTIGKGVRFVGAVQEQPAVQRTVSVAVAPEAVEELPAPSVFGPPPRRPLVAAMIVATAALAGTAAWWVWPATRSSQSPSTAVRSTGESARSTPSARQSAPVPLISPGQSAFWDAVIEGNVTQAIVSIRAGADINGLDTRSNSNGRRPLNWAAIRNDTAMIAALLDAGADINSANLTGFTPLHHAAEAGSKEAVTLLIAKGANLSLRNRYEQTPEQTANAANHAEIAEMLREAMTRSK